MRSRRIAYYQNLGKRLFGNQAIIRAMHGEEMAQTQDSEMKTKSETKENPEIDRAQWMRYSNLNRQEIINLRKELAIRTAEADQLRLLVGAIAILQNKV